MAKKPIKSIKKLPLKEKPTKINMSFEDAIKLALTTPIKNSKITTIEGLSKNGDHPVQQAWDEVDVPQCGYCQAGQIMTAAALLKSNPKPTVEQIDNAMHGNLCRCCSYHRIREAVQVASTKI